MSIPVKITVVTPSFNGEHTIRETLESVARQNHPQIEHIVMDGGSTDGTPAILREFPHLKWFSEKDEGHYHAMNKGIAMATGEAIAILNADDCYCDGILAKVADALAKHPEWDAVFGDIIFVDGEGKEIFRREEACSGYSTRPARFWDWQPSDIIRAQADLRPAGLCDTEHLKNCCDYDFLLRMALNGCKVGHIREYVVRLSLPSIWPIGTMCAL